MNIVYARPDFVRIVELFKRFQQFHIRARGFDGNHVRIQRGDGIHDVVELAIAHMGVDLRVVFRHRGIDTESFHPPCQIRIPVATLQRQAFPQGRFVDLDDTDTGGFQIRHFIAQREGYLFRNRFTADVLTREGPAKNGHRAGQHAFYRFVGQGLSVFCPLDGDRLRAADIADDHRRFDAAGAVALYPAVLRENKAVQVFAEVFHHIVTLGFTVYQHVQPQSLLLNDRLLNVFGDAGAVAVSIEIALFEVQTQAADLGGLGEGADGGGWPGRQLKAGALRFGANFVDALALAVLSGNGRQTLLYRSVVHAG